MKLTLEFTAVMLKCRNVNVWYGPFLEYAIAGGLVDLQYVVPIEGGVASYNYLPGEPIPRKEVAETIYRLVISTNR